MGIPGLLKEIGKGERVALTKLAIEHLERNQRPLRVAIDVAIWNFQNQAGQGGKNPALRTLYFRLLRLLALPIHPVFVYDGRNKPLTKRGRTVSKYTTCIPNEMSKRLVRAFRFPHHIAPGEAEAECAFLQRNGIVDVVMSQDVDAIMFGSTLTLRDWSKEGTRGNKSPTHVNFLDSSRIKMISGLDPDGMILVALLSGGDYDEVGIPGFGSALACEAARAGFGTDLLELVRNNDSDGLDEWRQRLQYELETNESGYFRKRHKSLKIPHDFPDSKILGYYMHPAVSSVNDLSTLNDRWIEIWESDIDVRGLREYTAQMFDWSYRSGARRFIRGLAQPLFQNKLLRGTVDSTAFSASSISEKRHHFINDGIPELRLSVTPASVVGVDLEAEEDNPAYAADRIDEDEDDILIAIEEVPEAPANDEDSSTPLSPSKKKRSPPWDPYISEKWWIPETLLQLGLPAIAEGWDQLQRDICADPKRFATRNALRTTKGVSKMDSGMRSGAIHSFLQGVRKPVGSEQPVKIRAGEIESKKASRAGSELSACTTDDMTGAISDSRSKTHKKTHKTSRSKTPKEVPEQEREEAGANDSIQFASAKGDGDEALLTQEDMRRVTQRKSRQQKPRSDPAPSEPVKRPIQKLRPIESFFPQSKILLPGDKPKENTAASSSDSTKTAVLLASVESSNDCLLSSRRTALGRESLPGTWREAEGGNTTSKHGPRVSYIDLTSD